MKYILDPEYCLIHRIKLSGLWTTGPDGSVLYGNSYESLKEFTFDSVQKRWRANATPAIRK